FVAAFSDAVAHGTWHDHRGQPDLVEAHDCRLAGGAGTRAKEGHPPPVCGREPFLPRWHPIEWTPDCLRRGFAAFFRLSPPYANWAGMMRIWRPLRELPHCAAPVLAPRAATRTARRGHAAPGN